MCGLLAFAVWLAGRFGLRGWQWTDAEGDCAGVGVWAVRDLARAAGWRGGGAVPVVLALPFQVAAENGGEDLGQQAAWLVWGWLWGGWLGVVVGVGGGLGGPGGVARCPRRRAGREPRAVSPLAHCAGLGRLGGFGVFLPAGRRASGGLRGVGSRIGGVQWGGIV